MSDIKKIPHVWDDDDRCVNCGDKDWMGDDSCSRSKVTDSDQYHIRPPRIKKFDGKVHLIVAMDPSGVIGKDGTLPWHIPDDLKHFKLTTSGSSVVMGRKTFESLNMPNGLPNRQNFVISRKPTYSTDVKWVTTLEYALELGISSSPSGDVFIIGGATIYEEALKNDLVDFMHVSFVYDHYEGDTYFPEYDKRNWSDELIAEHDEFLYRLYSRGY